MTEKEKRQQGILYDANNDAALSHERTLCKDLCFALNLLKPSQIHEQRSLLEKLLGKIGKDCVITTPFFCDYGYNIMLGEHFYTNHNCVILDAGPVTFGDHVFIGPNCVFSTAGHPLDAGQRNRGLEYAYPITVGNNVWIGANVTVLPGVTIGDNTVVGAGSVVDRDLPAGVVAVGVPCRPIRTITSKDAKKYGFEKL